MNAMFRKHVLDYLQASDRLVCRRCRQNVDDAGEMCPVTAPRMTILVSGEIDGESVARTVLASPAGKTTVRPRP